MKEPSKTMSMSSFTREVKSVLLHVASACATVLENKASCRKLIVYRLGVLQACSISRTILREAV